MHKHLAGLLLLAATTAGCTVKPGDYRIYRLASNELSNACTDTVIDPDHTGTSTYFTPNLIAIYAADSDSYFLEGALGAILGSRDGNGYTFTGNETINDNWNTDETGLDRNFVTSRVTDEVWDLELKGKGLSGTHTVTTTTTCNGGMDECAAVDRVVRSCTQVVEVFGSEVDDVDIEYVINGGGGLP